MKKLIQTWWARPPARAFRTRRIFSAVLCHLPCILGAAALGGCAEPPALVLVLQVQEGDAINTSNVTGLLFRIGEEERSLQAIRDTQETIELNTAPAGPTPVVVFACTANAACRQGLAAFVGCVVQDLKPSPEPVTVFVRIFDIATPAPECEQFLDPS